jgi:hypothetical protein
MRNVCKISDGETKGNRPIGRPKRRKEDNIKLDIKVTGCEDVDWIQLAQDSVQLWAAMNMVKNLWVPQKMNNFLNS